MEKKGRACQSAETCGIRCISRRHVGGLYDPVLRVGIVYDAEPVLTIAGEYYTVSVPGKGDIERPQYLFLPGAASYHVALAVKQGRFRVEQVYIFPDGQAEVRPVSPWLRNRVMAEPYLKLVSRRR